MKSTINVEKLERQEKFRLEHQLKQDEILEFLQPYIKSRSVVMICYFVLLLGLTILLGVLFGIRVATVGFVGLVSLRQVLLGILSIVAMVPAHELIHGLTYGVFGAKDVRYHALWRKCTFMAVAHDFVIDGMRFVVVALAPFAVLSALLIGLAIAFPKHMLFYTILETINLMFAGGDFAMVNFLYLNRDRRILTYDDDEARITYFYSAISS